MASLMVAENTDIAKILLENGAIIYAKNSYG